MTKKQQHRHPTDDEIDAVRADVVSLQEDLKPKKGGVADVLAHLDTDRALAILGRVLEMIERFRKG